MPTIAVNGPQPYKVRIGAGLNEDIAQRCAEIGASRAGIVFQPPLRAAAEHLAELVGTQGVVPVLIEVPDAEAAKQLSVVGGVWDKLGENGFNRRDVIIGLGGGATTDMAGFVAAGWMRGIKIIQVPTTLLAMVDAAVGGKTGINTAAGK
ncbi:iron-containing alcohol dehydrogenase, partial [Corynebacterium sp.]